jgi:hypothetical protein
MNEEENTFRILKDLPPAVASRWCKFHVHTWTQWFQKENDAKTEYGTFRLWHYCIHCGLPKQKIVSVRA